VIEIEDASGGACIHVIHGLQCAVVCCCVLLCAAVCYRVLPYTTVCYRLLRVFPLYTWAWFCQNDNM